MRNGGTRGIQCTFPGMPGKPKQFRKTYIREWRKHRGLTQEQLSSRLEELGQHDLGATGLSMLENGKRGYTQAALEAIAQALNTDPASLLMRNPNDADAIWSVWDQAKPGERRMIVDIAKTVVKRTGTE
jgi:transcriptional regulator with XRE-family HTH domain